MNSTFAAPLAIVLTCTLAAQNQVTNGDFAKVDANGSPTGWTVQKFDFKPVVVSFDTAGLGADNAFSVTHGKANTSSTGIGELSQGIGLIVQSQTYELRADTAVGGGFNNGPGKFEFFVDGVSVAVMDFTTSRGSKPAGVTFRERVCVRFTAQKTSVSAQLRVEISRKFLGQPGRTPTAYLDNVYLAPTLGPVMCLRGERKAGGTVQVDVLGRPDTGFVFYAALSLLPSPVTIPGWTGKFALGNPMVLLLVGKTDTSGKSSLAVPTPVGAARVYVQGGHPGMTGGVDLGNAQLINLY
jgi:hypothetical protein